MALSKYLDPKNDIAFRKIFGTEKNKDILLHFLNDILSFTEDSKIVEIEFLSPIQNPEIAIKKQSIVDILCRDKKGVTYIIEMQVAKTKGFEKRAQYYAAKAYGNQANTGEKYYNLKEIIFIAIADCEIFPNKTYYKSDHVILDRITFEHDLKDFYFTFIELPKFNKSKEELMTIEDKWYYFFKHAHKTRDEDLAGIIGGDNIIRRAYDELNQFHWNEKELLAYEEMKRVDMDNTAVLDQKLDDARAEGIQIGEAKGKALGKAEGIQIGEAKGAHEAKITIAKNLLKSGLSINLVAKSTGLTVQEIDKLRD